MAEIAIDHLRKRHRSKTGNLLRKPQTFIAEEEERLVLHDWSTQSCAKLVPDERRFLSSGRKEEVLRIKYGVTSET